MRRALADGERGLGHLKIRADDTPLRHLANIADGDARKALNSLEIAAITTLPQADGFIVMDLAVAEACIQKKAVVYDGDGDAHYDTISAFIKSMRGGDPDAALYWLAKMIHAGEDPRFITRRILICAAEDVGLADPMALVLAVAAHTAAEFTGWPEARIPIAEATVYIATASKSNSACVAIDKALEDVRSGRTLAVPQLCATPATRARNGWDTGRITNTRTIFPAILWRRITWGRPAGITSRRSRVRKKKSRSAWKNGAARSKPCVERTAAGTKNERPGTIHQKGTARAAPRAGSADVPAPRRERDSAQARALLARQRVWREARAVLFYSPRPDEIDLLPLLEQALAEGQTVGPAAVFPGNGAYAACQIENFARDCAPGKFGIPEPAARCPTFPLNRLDLALVPGVGFDAAGHGWAGAGDIMTESWPRWPARDAASRLMNKWPNNSGRAARHCLELHSNANTMGGDSGAATDFAMNYPNEFIIAGAVILLAGIFFWIWRQRERAFLAAAGREKRRCLTARGAKRRPRARRAAGGQ